jgi:hypothetical protein
MGTSAKYVREKSRTIDNSFSFGLLPATVPGDPITGGSKPNTDGVNR